MARYHPYDDNHFQRTDLGPVPFPQLIPPGSNFQHGPVAPPPLPEIRVPPWSTSGPGRGYPMDATPMDYGLVEERRHSEIPPRSGNCHVPTPSPPIALRYFPPPGEYRHGPPPRQELAPTAPGVPPGMAGGPRPCVVNLRPRDERGPPEQVQPRNLAPFVVRDISKVLQERESLRKDRGVYLTRTQSLAMEMVRLQKQLRELAGPGAVRLGHEEPKLWALTQLLERIEAQLSSLRRADDLAIDQLLRLQQESVHQGHPPPALPWTSDTDILLPEQGNKKSQADDSAMDQLLRLQQESVHLGHPPPALPWTSDADILLAGQGNKKQLADDSSMDQLLRLQQKAMQLCHPPPALPWRHPQERVLAKCAPFPQPKPQEPPHLDPPRPQHPPHSNPPRTQHPLTATVRPLIERHTGLIKSVKASDDSKEAPATGLILAKVGGEPMEISFSKDEHPATLLPSDLVTFQVLTDLLTNQPRAVNIQLKLPETFQVTQEKRKRGLIMDIKDGSCSIMYENHSNLWADMSEKLSEGDLELMDEVEFTALRVDGAKHAVRLLKLPSGTVTFGSSQNKSVEEGRGVANAAINNKEQGFCLLEGDKVQFKLSTNPKTKAERAVNLEILPDTSQCTDTEEQRRVELLLGSLKTVVEGVEKKQRFREDDVLTKAMLEGDKRKRVDSAEAYLEEAEVVSLEHHEGTVIRVPPMEHRSVSKLAVNDNKELLLGRLKTVVEGEEKKLLFRADDVLTKATMLEGDKVQFKISTNPKTRAERVVNLEILPDTFECGNTTEHRRVGVVLGLNPSFGYIKYPRDPKLVFDLSEVMEENKLSISEMVEFTLVPNVAAGSGNQAIRIRRFTENVFSRTSTLQAPSTEKKKMTIKLMNCKETTQKDARNKSEYKADQKRSHSPGRRDEGHRRRSRSGERSLRNRSRSGSGRTERSSRKRSKSRSGSRERSSRKRNRSRSPREKTVTSTASRELSRFKDSTDIVEDEKTLRKKRELEELNMLIAQKKAILAMELQTTTPVSMPMPQLGEARRDELYDPFQVDEEQENQPKGETMRVEEQLPKQFEQDESYLYGEEADYGDERRMEDHKHSERHEWRRVDQMPILCQHEQETTYAHRPSDGDKPLDDWERSLGQTPLFLQRYRTAPVLGEAHRDEMCDPFRAKGETIEGQRDDLQRHRSDLRDGRYILCSDGMEPGLCLEEQFPEQTGVDEEESYLYGEDDWKREDQTHRVGQHEQETTDAHRPSDGDKPFAKIKTLLESIGLNLKTWGVNEQIDRRSETSDLDGINTTLAMLESSQNEQLSSQQHSETYSPDSERLRSTSPVRSSTSYSGHQETVHLPDRYSDVAPGSRCSSLHQSQEVNQFELEQFNWKGEVKNEQRRGAAKAECEDGVVMKRESKKKVRRSGEGDLADARRVCRMLLNVMSTDTDVASSQQPSQDLSRCVTSENVKTVWICGHSLVGLASHLAESPTYSVKMGKIGTSVRSYWKGVQGMTWQQLVPQLHQLKLNWPNPDLLLIHLGDNDINKSTTEDLLSSIKTELTSIRNIFPQCLIVWSDILPIHFEKHGSEGLQAVDRIHDVINHRVHAMVAELGGTAVTHENIKPELFHLGGIHLSNFIIERFYLNIQHFVDQWEKEVNRAALSTLPDVSLSLSPTDSSSSCSGTPRRAERGGLIKNPASDDSGNTSVSLHRRAKRRDPAKNSACDDSGTTSVSLQQAQKQRVREWMKKQGNTGHVKDDGRDPGTSDTSLQANLSQL